QVAQALHVLLELLTLRVRHEHDAVRTTQHELARRVVIHLARHGVQLHPRAEAGDRAQVEREEIEEQRAVCLRSKRDHRPLPRCGYECMHVLQVARLTRTYGAVVDDLAGDFLRRVIDQRHRASTARVRPAGTRAGALPPGRARTSAAWSAPTAARGTPEAARPARPACRKRAGP